jgi:hypothetical protein
MRVQIVAATVLALTLLASSQSSSVEPVSADDVLQQLDTAILIASLDKRTPTQTLDLVKEIVLLNQMQVQHASMKGSTGKEAEGLKALTGNFNQSFYDLRRDVCKNGPSRVVDLDGELHNCN